MSRRCSRAHRTCTFASIEKVRGAPSRGTDLPSLTFAAVRCWSMCFAEMPPAKSKPYRRSKGGRGAHAALRPPTRPPPRPSTGRWAVLPVEIDQAASRTAEPAAGASPRRSRRGRSDAGEGAGASGDRAYRSVTPPPPASPAVQDSPEAPSTGNKSPHSKRSRGHASPRAHGVLDGMDVDSAGQASAGDGASRSGVAELMRVPNFDSSDEEAPRDVAGGAPRDV